MAYPSLPASPTLTNPDMILPYGEYDSTPSPPYGPSDPKESWKSSRPDDMHFSIGPPHAPLGPITPTTPIIYGNGTMLSDIGEVTEAESTPAKRLPGPAERRAMKLERGLPLRSSPALGHSTLLKRTKTGSHQRSVSIESASTVTTDGQTAELFQDFDDGVSVDDSNFQGDDEGSVADSYSEEVIAAETARLSKRENGIGGSDDTSSSAALSRRAEQILLNAKLRLNNMEGNLTRARSSLYITPSGSLTSIHSSSPLSRSTPSPPQDRRILPQLGVSPAKHRQLRSQPESSNSSLGHSRVYSENSIPSVVGNTPFPRSASAGAGYITSTGVGSSNTSPRTDRSPEDAREDVNGVSTSGFSSPSKASPPRAMHLEPLSEDEVVPGFEHDRASIRSGIEDGYLDATGDHRVLSRSASAMQMRDLRDQMHDLKGRLSVLRDRARDESMKRRSMQSLRTPSPFTAAEQWYTGANGYGRGGLSADAGVAHLPWREDGTFGEKYLVAGEEAVKGADDSEKFGPEYANSEVTSVYEDVGEDPHATEEAAAGHKPPIAEENDDETPASEKSIEKEMLDGENGDDYSEEIVNREELDDYESDASLYHDSVVSHEDREDAFDYEHFFLHSAMGTISQQRLGRRDSVGSFSSEDSVETTRGPPAPSMVEGAGNSFDEVAAVNHPRSESSQSVSTLASFATATEGRATPMENDDNGGDDNYAVQHVDAPPPPSSGTPLTAKRTTFGPEAYEGPPNELRSSSIVDDRERLHSNDFHRPSVASFDSFVSVGTTRSFPLINKPKSRQSLTPQETSGSRSLSSDSVTLTDEAKIGGDRLQSSPVHMLANEDQVLVERLVASLGKCVLGLQEAESGSFEGRVWRRRLDAAQRVLEGQEGAV